MKPILLVSVLLLLGGCMSVELSWNRFRVGILETEKRQQGSDVIARESTVGLDLKWAPDINWAEVFNIENK